MTADRDQRLRRFLQADRGIVDDWGIREALGPPPTGDEQPDAKIIIGVFRSPPLTGLQVDVIGEHMEHAEVIEALERAARLFRGQQ